MNRKHEWRKFGIELQQSLILYSFPEEMEQIPIWLAYYFNAQQKNRMPYNFLDINLCRNELDSEIYWHSTNIWD